jgi:hypothetical protein
MSGALRNLQDMLRLRKGVLTIWHTVTGSCRHDEAEAFIRATFKSRFDADVTRFAPNLMALELDDRIVAAAGWRCAADEPLFLETYLDVPIETAVARLAGHPVERSRIVEVGNLAAARAGGSIDVILTLSRHLDRLGYEWVAFTATRELIGIFRKLGLAPLALAPANPERLGDQAGTWGHYYDSAPVVVAGRIRLALDKSARRHD